MRSALYLTFILLLQLYSHSQPQPLPSPQPQPQPPPSPQPQPPPSTAGLLTLDEVSALSDISTSLEMPVIVKPFSNLSCNDNYVGGGDFIDCNCTKDQPCHVTNFSCYRLGLAGQLPEALGNLIYLEKIDLSGNNIHGPIPATLGKLSSLKYLDLSMNQLEGPIPDIFQAMKSLENLDLSDNKIHGHIPATLRKLSSLKYLDLSMNQLDGPIPNIFQGMKSLGYLDLSMNQLNGSIPDDFQGMKSLENLFLYKNFLTGNIPKSLGALPSLDTLSLGQNLLSGTIPKELGNIANLKYLGLKENNLDGGLPERLGNLKKLEYLHLSSNNLNGTLPQSFYQLSNLQVLSIFGNNFSGQINGSIIKNLTQLQSLLLMGNKFEGPLPDEISMLETLEYLWVSDLRSSTVSKFPNLAKLTRMEHLILRHCAIEDKIPPYIGEWKSLSYLDLSFNKLTGGIPSSVDSFVNLEYMYLTGNMLSGSIENILSRSLKKNISQNMDMSYNNFTPVSNETSNNSRANLFACCHLEAGKEFSPLDIKKIVSCPDEERKYTSLYIDCGGGGIKIEGNRYESDNGNSSSYVSPGNKWAYSRTGDFITSNSGPGDAEDYIRNATCGALVADARYATARLSPLSLRYHGRCLVNGNYTVELYFAEIVYTDNNTYGILGKRIFDVYIQQKKVLENFNLTNEKGDEMGTVKKIFPDVIVDKNALEIRFYWAGKGSVYIPPKLYGPLISAIAVTPVPKPPKQLSPLAIAMIAVASLAIALLVLASVWKWVLLRREEHAGMKFGEKFYTFRQIIDATQNFSDAMKIGTLYKADMKDGNIFAVKQLFSTGTKEEINKFNNEMNILDPLNHENVIRLLGHYVGDKILMLVFEYMENKSLDAALFGSPSSSVKLSWKVRYEICLGVARGLSFLHGRASGKIIHRDIRASNILLDKDLKAKISDFELATVLQGETASTGSRITAGTYANMAPEYATRGMISEKLDVYSFGIGILEIVSGRSNEEVHPKEETKFLLDTAYTADMDGKLVDLVDKSVKYGLDRSDYVENQATTLLKLAMRCVHHSPNLRPTMNDVVSVIEGTKSVMHLYVLTGPSLLSRSRSLPPAAKEEMDEI